MRFLIFIMMWILVLHDIHADTLTVKQDGTGDYTYIQNAIGWSSSGDVILVYPGTYYENIDCFGRDSLTIASLFLLNPADSNIHNTIINGNQTGSCISAFRGENNLRILGFTIINGLRQNGGGGIYLKEVTVSVEYCIIKENIAYIGGGLYIDNSYVYLSKTKICRNHAYSFGGGILYGGYDLIFDTINLCDLYLNNAQIGTDYIQGISSPAIPIILDTATVFEPDHYYFACEGNNGYDACNFEFTINHAKIQDVNADIFVDPSGNDDNNGLSPEDPLKTLSFALLKVKSDSLQKNTVHLANGVYSFLDGNKFPIGLKNNVPLIGESKESTIIDLDSLISFCTLNSRKEEITLKNFTIKNGKDSLYSTPCIFRIWNCNHAFLQNMAFTNCSVKNTGNILISYGCDSLIIQNSTFKENHAAQCLNITGSDLDTPCYSELTCCKIQNNYPGPFQTYDNYGMGLYFSNGMGNESYMTTKLINCQITDNADETTDLGYPATSGVAFEYNTIAYVINTSIGNNNSTNPLSGAVGIAQHSTVSFNNSIISGNNVHQILMLNTEPDMGCEVHLYNSLVENGENGILNLSPYSTVYYDSTNLNNDPKWVETGEFPYALLNDSPCINTGTQYLPEGIVLPDTDLMGGPRISGGEVDMGAYEFLFVGLNENDLLDKIKYFTVSPNPFRDKLTVYFEQSVYGKNVEILLYDIKGNLIKPIFCGKADDQIFNWSTDNEDVQINPGVYFLKITIESSLTDTVKVIKI